MKIMLVSLSLGRDPSRWYLVIKKREKERKGKKEKLVNELERGR